MMPSHSRSYSVIGLKFAGTGEDIFVQDGFAQAAVEVVVDGAAPCIKVILVGRDDNGGRPNSNGNGLGCQLANWSKGQPRTWARRVRRGRVRLRNQPGAVAA